MLPLEGVRVVEFAHMVMGPRAGWCSPTSARK
jgi:crotonobetainyl-CoA:carnitine CoA-transferase CaiB-like acyl-CoA transferase